MTNYTSLKLKTFDLQKIFINKKKIQTTEWVKDIHKLISKRTYA